MRLIQFAQFFAVKDKSFHFWNDLNSIQFSLICILSNFLETSFDNFTHLSFQTLLNLVENFIEVK